MSLVLFISYDVSLASADLEDQGSSVRVHPCQQPELVTRSICLFALVQMLPDRPAGYVSTFGVDEANELYLAAFDP